MQKDAFSKNILRTKIILVTGASKGIGREVAKHYSKHGATVILLARNVKLLTSLYDEIINLNYPVPMICPFNLATATPEDFTKLANSIIKKFDKLDGLVLNAGVLGSLTPIEHYPIEQWYQVMQVNLNSPFILIQSLIAALKKSTNASVIFTSSNQAENPTANWGAYAIASSGITTMQKILSQEFINQKIKFNIINPIAIDTGLHMNAYPGKNLNLLQKIEDLLPKYLELIL